MRFKLQKDNKYHKLKDMLRRCFISSMFSTISTLLYFGINPLGGICFKTINYRYVSTIVNDKYDRLSDGEKNEYVSKAFLKLLDNSDEFSEEAKEEASKVSYFLNDYGYLYDIDDLANLESRLFLVDIKYDNLEEVPMVAYYNYQNNRIVTSKNIHLPHELSHLGSNLYCKFVAESITSSLDFQYYNDSSYNFLMRNEVLLLGEIVGRENLIKSYISGENFDDLMKCSFSKEEYSKLLKLFDKAMIYFSDESCSYIDFVIVNYEIRDILKGAWERKYDKKINEDAIAWAIYNSCWVNSSYMLKSTLFYKDEFCFDCCNYMEGLDDSFVIDVDDRNYTIKTATDYYDIGVSSKEKSK